MSFTKKVRKVQETKFDTDKKLTKCVKVEQNKHTKIVFSRSRRRREETRWWMIVKCTGGTFVFVVFFVFLFFCFEHMMMTVLRQRPDLSSPDCLQPLVDKSLSCHLLKGLAWLNQAAHFTLAGGWESMDQGGVVTGAWEGWRDVGGKGREIAAGDGLGDFKKLDQI